MNFDAKPCREPRTKKKRSTMKNPKNLRIDTSFTPTLQVEKRQRWEQSTTTSSVMLYKARKRAGIRYAIFLICFFISIIFTVVIFHLTFVDESTRFQPSDNKYDFLFLSSIHTIATIPYKIDQETFEEDIINLKDVIKLQNNETSPLNNCSPTFQVRFYKKESPKYLSSHEGGDGSGGLGDNNNGNDHNHEWYIQTLDQFGNEKSVGGDEFYITYTDNQQYDPAANTDEKEIEPTAVAFVHDLNDGTYKLDFVSSPMGNFKNIYDNDANSDKPSSGRIKVNFEYTCGIGKLNPPTKKNWKSSGMMYRTAAYMDNVQQPPIRNFQHPSSINLSNYSLVIFFGDSTMRQLVVKNETLDSNDQKRYFRPNVDYRNNVRSELTKAKVNQHFLKKLRVFHGKQLRNLDNLALVLGSSIWDLLVTDNIQEDDFDDHLEACKNLIHAIQEKHPKVDIYWKGTSALHAHRVNCIEANYDYQDCLNSTKYLSNSRVVNLERKQKQLMGELKIPYIDLYPAYFLSGFRTAPGDGRHSVPALNELILNTLFSPPGDDEKITSQ